MKIIVRAPENMAFSRETIDAIKGQGMIFSRANRFVKPEDYLIINHGSQAPIEFGRRVKSAYVVNRPEDVHLSINKNEMLETVRGHDIPFPVYSFLQNGQGWLEAIDQVGIPAIIKPNNGHRGNGMIKVTKPSDLLKIQMPDRDVIMQQYLGDALTSEYRFNYFNGKLVNVSRKLLPEEKDRHPGVFDGWLSIGQATKLHKTAHRVANDIRERFPFGSVAVDLFRCGQERPTYLFCEVNTSYGLGPMTAERLKNVITEEIENNNLEAFKVV